MAKYHVETDNGTYEVEVEEGQPNQLSAPVDYGQVAGEAFKAATTGPLSATQSMAENPESLTPYAPAAGAAMGTAFGPAGSAIGAGLGAIAGRMGDIAFGKSAPVEPTVGPFAPKEAISPMIQSAVAGLPEVDFIKKGIQNVAQKAGTRALGFTKRMLKRGGEEQAKQTAQTMMDKGVIKFGSGAKATLNRAEDLAEQAGQSMGQAGEKFAKEGLQPLDTNSIGMKISEQLSPKYSGGAYDAEKKVVDEILDTVGAHGNGPIDFKSAQALKEKLQELGKFLTNTDATKSTLYRRASGIVREAIDESVKASKSSAAPKYLAGKKLYGQASQAIEGLTDKVSAQMANNPIGPYGMVSGAARLAAGDVPGGLAAMGVVEGVKRTGAASTAAFLNSLNQGGLNPASKAAYAAFIESILNKRKR